jgi:hypothetical protein
MRSMVAGASILCPLRLASLATSPARRGRNRSIGRRNDDLCKAYAGRGSGEGGDWLQIRCKCSQH